MSTHNINPSNSLRLQQLQASAAPSNVVADIGCDHAYLPILLIQNNICKKVIASDIAKGPLQKAAANIHRFNMTQKITVRKGMGLSTLEIGEADTIVIAGMGGNMIADILAADKKIAQSAQKLILQPMTTPHRLREYLYQNGYIILKEDLVKEDGRIYSIITTAWGQTPISTNETPLCGRTQFAHTPFESDKYISPALMAGGSALVGEFISKYIKESRKIINSLQNSQNNKELLRYHQTLLHEFEAKLQKIEKHERMECNNEM